MFVGTCSDAGKSILNTAFCRIFRQDGYRPAPFKAQNMSLNSCSTPEGGEIGRAQAVQAEACGILPHTDMNPVLLKPSTDQTSQVILNGKAVGNMSAREYFRSGNKTQLFTEAVKAFHRLEENHNPIVLEGAGSISELNLRDRDITNMRMAKEVDAATYLVADIDRGGVFAAVYGSVMLLPEEERCLIKGVIINKFRGDVSLFEEGRQIIRELTGVPVVGVIPYYKDIHIEEEDSVALEAKASAAVAGKINVAVIRLPRMSNFTDFNALEREGGCYHSAGNKKYHSRFAGYLCQRGGRSCGEGLPEEEKSHRHLWRVSDDGSADRGSRAGRRYANRDRRIGFTASGHGDAGCEGGLSESFPF